MDITDDLDVAMLPRAISLLTPRGVGAPLLVLAQSSTLQRGRLGAWFSSFASVGRSTTETPAAPHGAR
jgi:hypothetical protein